ncbi:MAG: hypothetical protein JWM35_2157, partial [Verrucomicrobia bacterium]|nr:hypothetical protein [Verrucomicrobiota bacterium]
MIAPVAGWVIGTGAIAGAAGWWLGTRRRAEPKASEAADSLHGFLFERAVEGIYENPIGGGFRRVNPAMARILGYSSVEELERVSASATGNIYVQAGRRAKFLKLVEEHDTVTDFESEIRLPDGSTRWVSENVRGVRDASGRLVSLQGFVTDITSRKQAEGALRESEERYRRLYLANPHAMWIYDRESLQILSVNDAAIELYGYSREEFERMTLEDIRPENEREHLRSAVRAMHPGSNQPGVFTHRAKDGHLLRVEMTTLVFNSHGREQVLAIATDITEHESARAALDESESRYRLLFENSPIGIVEYDYRSTIEWMKSLRAAGVTDLAAWADANPETWAKAMRDLPVIGINAAALRLLKAPNAQEVLANLERVIPPAGWAMRRQSYLAA